MIGRRTRALVGLGCALALALTGCGDEAAPPVVDVGPVVYGPACPRLPVGVDGFPGTAADLVDTVAGGEDPLLSTFGLALDATGLRTALADPVARYTVFAPTDAAFEELPAGTLREWLADPRGELFAVLAHHVVVGSFDADALATGPATGTLGDQPLVVTGGPAELVVDEQQAAGVLCGNIATSNATVFVIDRVLLPDGE